MTNIPRAYSWTVPTISLGSITPVMNTSSLCSIYFLMHFKTDHSPSYKLPTALFRCETRRERVRISALKKALKGFTRKCSGRKSTWRTEHLRGDKKLFDFLLSNKNSWWWKNRGSNYSGLKHCLCIWTVYIYIYINSRIYIYKVKK